MISLRCINIAEDIGGFFVSNVVSSLRMYKVGKSLLFNSCKEASAYYRAKKFICPLSNV